jgi:4-hydroxybenzoate polyprenyltransferase
LLGAIAMRGAGCVYNDIVDADLDRKVARTAARPVASGAVSKRAAWVWLGALCLVGLGVLLQLRWQAQVVALASLLLVAAYPFMKRITWWPQVWLGLVFSWAALVGWVELRGDAMPVMAALYLGSVFWVIGYDTIYAMQDREDDALVGIRSSALRLGNNLRLGVALFYLLAVLCWTIAFWLLRHEAIALLAVLPVAAHLGLQIWRLRSDDAGSALDLFRSNRSAGLLMALGCWVVGNAGL